MKLIIVPSQASLDQQTTPTDTIDPTDGAPRLVAEPQAERCFKWYLPFLCKSRGYGYVNGERIAARCGSRGCLECNQISLRKWSGTSAILRRHPGEKMYGIILTPPNRVKHQSDVSDFLRGVRKVFRSWERSSAGLGALYWVAECVVKWDEDPTEIQCPVQLKTPTMKETTAMTESAKERILEAITDCKDGGNCPYCRGRGVLPSVHLHAHAVAITKPFLYSQNIKNTSWKTEFKQDFNGRSFEGLCNEHGLGHQAVTVLRSVGGMADYISKSMMVYISKGTRVKKGAQVENSSVDWNISATDNLIASAIYGTKRARGKNGRAYGLKSSVKDAASHFTFGGDLLAVSDGCKGSEDGFTTLALNGQLGEHKEEEARDKLRAKSQSEYLEEIDRKENRRNIHVVTVGKKALEGGGLGERAISIFKETQLDTPQEPPELMNKLVDDNYSEGRQLSNLFLFSADGKLESKRAPKLGKTTNLRRWWDNAPVIRDNQWFIWLDGLGGSVIGRGGAVVYIDDTAGLTFADIGARIETMEENDYAHWMDIANHPNHSFEPLGWISALPPGLTKRGEP